MKTTIGQVKTLVREALAAPKRPQIVYVADAAYFEDGKQSFWKVMMGIKPIINAKKLNAVLKAGGFRVFDRNFGAPLKNFMGLRTNFVSSEYDPNHDAKVGKQLQMQITRALTAAGFEVHGL